MGALSAMPAACGPLIDHAVAARGLAAAASGDHALVLANAAGMLLAAIDGLGHGVEAEEAAVAAAAALAAAPDAPAVELMERCHEALRQTRGAAMTLATLDAAAATMTWLAVGNVEGVLLRAGEDGSGETLYVQQRAGVVGLRLPPLRAATLALRNGDVLILATDGIRNGFEAEAQRNAPAQRIAERILARHGRSSDDALALVARWRGAAGARP
jgi:negative regulator of sigma-B (phosphoserine phosphatase)